jgi:hypothetical protein
VTVTEEEDEVTTLLRQHRLVASSDNPNDNARIPWRTCLSLNDHVAWEGNIKDVVTISIRDSCRPLVDDDEAGPNGAVKDEPANAPADPRRKPLTDKDYNFFQYYDRSGHRRRH